MSADVTEDIRICALWVRMCLLMSTPQRPVALPLLCPGL